MLTIFITFGFLAIARCQQDCSTEWENQRKCMATERAQYAPKRLSDNDRNQIRASIRQCYARAGCRDPFLTDVQEATMKDCSRDLRRSIKQDLKNCLGRSNNKDYNLPKDNDSQFGWGQDVARIKRKDQKCQPSKGKEKEFGQCLQQALKQQFQQRQQSKPTDPCESRYKCYQQWEHENCYNRERDAKRQVCACVKSANLEKYKNDYRSCLRSKNVPVDDADFNLMTVDKLANKYCNGTKDPCGGYNGRQSQLRSSNKNSNNNNNNNRGNNWNNNNNNNRGNGNQGNNWNNNNNNNQGSNWNNNNNQNGNNWNANSNTDNGGSDLNTYDLDSVDGDTSGGFPDVGSVLSSGGDGGGGGDLSSVLGSANTGLDPSTFFGGGALSGGGLAGNPLGGLGGGLFSGFGGAGGTDIFSQFSSVLDPTALFSGIGKKKK